MERTTAISQQQQIHLYVRSANNLVKKLLQETMHNQPLTSSDQPWALAGANFPLDNATLEGKVKDMRTCYNINALHTMGEDEQGNFPDAVNRLIDLMVLSGIDKSQATLLTAKIWDYIDGDQVAHRGGGEDLLYLNKRPSYLTANQMLADISEIRAIDGMTAEIYQKISPYLCTLPDDKLIINVNTLTTEHSPLIQALTENKLTKDTIKKWLDNRPLGGWGDVQQALGARELGLTSEEQLKFMPYFTIKSDYFRFDGKITTNDVAYQWYLLLHWQDPDITSVLQIETQ